MNKKTKIVNIIYILIYFCLMISIGYFHEPWSDEAQSWLIARDASLYDIFFKYSSYEGCFPLWVCILKLFISINLPYKFIYLISTVIVTISVGIIVFNNKISGKIRYLIPLNYWMFYQYGIIARNYSLIVLFWSILLLLYDERHEKKIRYIILLIFCSMINIYGMIISGILFLQFFIENVKELIKYKKIIKLDIFLYFVIASVYIFEIIILIPKNDLLMNMNYKNNWARNFLSFILTPITYQKNYTAQFINTMIIFLSIILCIEIKKNNNNNNIIFTIIEIAILLFLYIVRASNHHYGILFFILWVDIILNLNKSNIENKLFNERIFVIILCLSIGINAKTSIDDLLENYSGSYAMAEYINENIESNACIFSVGYECTSLLPYFESNIFYNRKTTFYTWDYSNIDNYVYNYYLYFKKMEYDFSKIYDILPEYILMQQHNLESNPDEYLNSVITNTNLYVEIYKTEGKNFFSGSYNEDECYILYKLKN